MRTFLENLRRPGENGSGFWKERWLKVEKKGINPQKSFELKEGCILRVVLDLRVSLCRCFKEETKNDWTLWQFKSLVNHWRPVGLSEVKSSTPFCIWVFARSMFETPHVSNRICCFCLVFLNWQESHVERRSIREPIFAPGQTYQGSRADFSNARPNELSPISQNGPSVPRDRPRRSMRCRPICEGTQRWLWTSHLVWRTCACRCLGVSLAKRPASRTG